MKMYVLVRKDLDIVYRFVQGSHALAQYSLEHNEEFRDWNNRTIVFLLVDDEQSLNKWVFKLGYREKKFSKFNEPDINNQLTAISCFDEGKIFANLPLA